MNVVYLLFESGSRDACSSQGRRCVRIKSPLEKYFCKYFFFSLRCNPFPPPPHITEQQMTHNHTFFGPAMTASSEYQSLKTLVYSR